MEKLLLSHPDLRLKDHLNNVVKATDCIIQQHSQKLLTDELKFIVQKSAILHDIGKINRFFQEFIRDVDRFSGDPNDKSHSSLSTVIAILTACYEKWDPLRALSVACCISGHHGSLPVIPSNRFSDINASNSIDDILSGLSARTLRKQLENLDFSCLKSEFGISLQFDQRKSDILRSAKKFLTNDLVDSFRNLSTKDALKVRVTSQIAYSLLLEADKAFLVVDDESVYSNYPKRLWNSEWISRRIGTPEPSDLNDLRRQIRDELIKKIANPGNYGGIYSLTAPTGIGKTLLAATWALKQKEEVFKQSGFNPKVILVLPFLSIVDQTVQEYERLLSDIGGIDFEGSWLLQCHSLANRTYNETLETQTERFFIDTWRSEIVITTYDQFLLCLLGSQGRHLMRFHNICDALIVMDEVQSIPCKMWQLLNGALTCLANIGNSSILLMSATLPSFIDNAEPLLQDHRKFFACFNRYEFCFNLDKTMTLDDFSSYVLKNLEAWIINKKRILITLNTRKSAREIFVDIKKWCSERISETIQVFLLSADLTPKDRIEKIRLIKSGKPCVVVSTQCIEAGVDIDMGLVIRDFAPWDSLVQIAGRCNREGKEKKPQTVEIVDLITKQNRRFADMIYDQVHLVKTRQLTENCKFLPENQTLEISEKYFQALAEARDTGEKYFLDYAEWRESIPVRELLRGKETEQYTFMVVHQDDGLLEDLKEAVSEENRWERREKLRMLSGRIANVSVSVYAKRSFNPGDYAEEAILPNHWIVGPEWYCSEKGLILESEVCNESLLIL